MKPFSLSRRLSLLVFVFLGCSWASSHPANAVDRAVVVGVNLYPGLADANGNAPNLEGCVADAESVAASLKSYGFEVKTLADGEATHEKIVAAIKATGQCEKFVFYFAGHGDRSTARGAILLPHDALEDSEKNDLSADDLNLLVKAVPATKRTVLLDSCFSGGMMRSIERRPAGTKPLHTRFHHRMLTRSARLLRGSKDIIMRPFATHADNTEAVAPSQNTAGGPPVCYFTATRANEQAGEYDFQGQRHGVFTYFLTRALSGADKTARWGDLQGKVTGSVSGQTADEQHPTLSPAYVDTVLFEAQAPPADPATSAPPATLWDAYNRDRVDRTKMFLTMNPDETTVHVGEKVEFGVTVATSGYLVVLEKGTSGHLNLLFPASAKAEDGRTLSGTTSRIPQQGFSYAPDSPGTERVRAILFSSADTAQQLLDAFRTSRSLDLATVPQNFGAVAASSAPNLTSDFTFEIVAGR